jgi:Ca2+-binding RTX toxin-like protein
MHGGGGNDRLTNLTYRDSHLYGGEGNDWLRAYSGNDLLSGGNGDDTLVGAGGDDVLVGGLGRDTLHGNAGNDVGFDNRLVTSTGDEANYEAMEEFRETWVADPATAIALLDLLALEENDGQNDTFYGIETIYKI